MVVLGALAFGAAASTDDVVQEVRLVAEEGGVRLTEAEGGHRLRWSTGEASPSLSSPCPVLGETISAFINC